MSCEHAESTTLLWLDGEAPEAHDLHVAACAECQEVIDGLERVQHALVPIAAALGVADVAATVQVNTGFHFARWGAALAVAASVLLAVRFMPLQAEVDVPADTDLASVQPLLPISNSLYGDLDAGLEDLDVALDSLAWDLNTL